MRSHAKAIVAASAVLLLTLALAANPASAEAPTVAIDPPSEVAYTSAKLTGEVDPKDAFTYWSFETSSDGGANWSGFGFEGFAEENTGSQPVTRELTGLTPGTEYKARLVATNFGDPEVISPVESFTTLAVEKPTISFAPITDADGEEAHFEGTIDPGAPEAAPVSDPKVEAAFRVTYRFECTPTCPGLEPKTLPADDGPVEFSVPATELQPDTPYTVKLFASNAGGESEAERSFHNPKAPPSVVPATVGALTHNSARLTALVDANSSPTTVSFEYDEDGSFSSPTVAPSGPGTTITGNGNKIAYVDILGLEPETSYHWRVKAQSEEGSNAATAPRSFTTWPSPTPKGPGVGAFGDRTIELVSDPKASVTSEAAMLSEDTNRILYNIHGGGPQTSFGQSGQVLADRTPTGWKLSNPLPPASTFGLPNASIVAVSPELDRFGVLATRNFASEQGGPMKAFVWEPDTERLTAGGVVENLSNAIGLLAASDPEVRQLFFRVRTDPAEPEGLYDLLAGTEPVEVGLMPGGTQPACGVDQNGFLNFNNSVGSQNWVSADGERLFFHSQGNDCGGPYNLYMREGGASGSTTLISGPALGPDRGAKFVGATKDGSEAFFSSETKLDPDDANQTMDIYRYRVGAGNECLTCVVAEAAVVSVNAETTAPIRVAESGERVYFTSSKALVPAARGIAGRKIYVWRAEGAEPIGFVAPMGSEGFDTTGGFMEVTATADGGVLVFQSNRPELNALTDSVNGGHKQAYRYDDREGALACLSCADSPTSAVGILSKQSIRGALDSPANLTADGRSLFFTTRDPLVGEDVNGRIDAYEWREGRIGLVTDGLFAERIEPSGLPPAVSVIDASPDGRTLLFVSRGDLIPGVDAGNDRLYVARIGGGFDVPVPPTPCGGEGCRGRPGQPPADPGPATPAFSGPGNAKPKPACRKGKVRKRGSCVKKKKAKQRNAKSKQRANANRGGSK